MRRQGRIALVVILAVGLLLGFVTLMTAFENPEESAWPSYSTFHSDRYGAQALHRILDEKGYNVEKNFFSPEKYNRQDSTINLVFLNPTSYCSDEEKDSLQKWIAKGNRLLYIPSQHNDIFYKQKLVMLGRDSEDPYMSGNLKPVKSTPSPLLAPVEGIVYAEDQDKAPVDVDDWFTPANENESFTYSFSSDSVPLIPLLTMNGDILMAKMKLGKGEVVMLTNPWMFTNGGLKDGDNLAFVLSVFDYMGGKRRVVRFDEYFHGYQMDPKSTPLNEPPVRAMVIGLLLTFALTVFSLRRRKARPVPVYVEPRRSIGEFVESLGRIYRKKQGEFFLYEDIASRFRIRIQQSLGLSNPAAIHDRHRVKSLGEQKWGRQETSILMLLLDDMNATGPDHDKDRYVWLAGRIREFSIRNHLDRHGSKETNR